MREKAISDRLSIRLHPSEDLRQGEGDLDEVITRDENGQVDFHLEQMDDQYWWMRWYSTPARPLAQELIVNLTPNGGFYDLESPMTYDEADSHYRPKLESLNQTIDHAIRFFGMGRILVELIAAVRMQMQDEKRLWPDRDVSYLEKLIADLEKTQKDYDARNDRQNDQEREDSVR